MKKRVLCLLAPGFEEIETIAPIDLLRRAEAEVVVASVNGEKLVAGRCGVTVQADARLADVMDQSFDLLFLPGGPGVKALREDGRAAQLARAYAQQTKPVAAICAAPTVLADAGLLAGRRFTAHFSVHDQLPGVLRDERVVKDGKLLTSRGAGTAVEFGLALVGELFGEGKAKEIAGAIMV
jgi:4-methyl-5(b-hydroxyethyl)-thiazole monophosphate biosynthesis